MHIAVTGASGKTGSRVVEEALARGWAVKAILRPNSDPPERLAGLIWCALSSRMGLP